MGVIRPPHQVCGMVPWLRIELNNFSYTGITNLPNVMNSTEHFIKIQLSLFISSCFELRDKLVPGKQLVEELVLSSFANWKILHLL